MDKRKKRVDMDKICMQTAALLMQGLLYHSVACGLYNVMADRTLAVDRMLFLLYIPLCLFAVIRDKCEKFMIFLLLHILVSGISVLVIPDTEMRASIGVCILVMAFLSVRQRLTAVHERNECPHIVSVFWFLLLYVLAMSIQRPILMQISYYEAFAFILFYAVYTSFHHTAGFIKSNEDMQNLPSGQIKGLNKMILLVFLLCMAAAMISIQYLPMGNVLEWIIGAFQMAIRMVVTWLIRLFSKEHVPVQEEAAEQMGELPPMEAGGTSLAALILDKIFWFVVYTLLIIGAAYFISRIFYLLYKQFYEHQKIDADESEFLWKEPLVKEYVGRLRKKKERGNLGGADQRIRRMYKKYIRREFGKKTMVPLSMTPAELESVIMKKKKEKEENMASEEYEILDTSAQERLAFYRKARYSQQECSKEEVASMKKVLNV